MIRWTQTSVHSSRLAVFVGGWTLEIIMDVCDAVLDPGGSLEYERNLAETRAQVSQEAFAKSWQELAPS
jgi:hypothetical protein